MSEHSADKDAPRCSEVAPWIHPTLRGSIGATYHSCRLGAGHSGWHFNSEGLSWELVDRPPPLPDPVIRQKS